MKKNILESVITSESKKNLTELFENEDDDMIGICDCCGKEIFESNIPIYKKINNELYGPYCCHECSEFDLLMEYATQTTEGYPNYMRLWS